MQDNTQNRLSPELAPKGARPSFDQLTRACALEEAVADQDPAALRAQYLSHLPREYGPDEERPAFDGCDDWEAWRVLNQAGVYEPMVGMGVSAGHGGDSYPYTIVRVSPSGSQFWASQDRFAYGGRAPEPECFTRRADGRYRARGRHGAIANLGMRYFHQVREF